MSSASKFKLNSKRSSETDENKQSALHSSMITDKPIVVGSIFNKPQHQEEISENIPKNFNNLSDQNSSKSSLRKKSEYQKLNSAGLPYKEHIPVYKNESNLSKANASSLLITHYEVTEEKIKKKQRLNTAANLNQTKLNISAKIQDMFGIPELCDSLNLPKIIENEPFQHTKDIKEKTPKTD